MTPARLLSAWKSDPQVRHAAAYTGGIVIGRIPPFLFLPVFAAVLSPETLGLYLTVLILADLVQTVSGLGMVQALGRFFPLAKGALERKELLGTALWTALAGAALMCGLALAAFLWPALRDSLEAARGLDMASFLLALGAGAVVNLVSLLIAYVRAEQRAGVFFAALSAGAVLEASAGAAMVALDAVSLPRILGLECAKGALILLILLASARADLSLRFSPARFRELFRFGFWLMPVGLFSWMLLSIDRFWLGQLAGLAEVGVYGFYYKFAMPAAILFQGWIISMDSHLFRAPPEAGRALVGESLSRYLKWAGAGLCLAGAAVPLAAWYAARDGRWLPADYLRGLEVYPLFLAATYVYYWAVHYASLLDFQFRSRRQLAYMGAAALGNFALCPAFVKAGSAFGVAAAPAIALSNLACVTVLLALQSRQAIASPGRAFWKASLIPLACLLGLSAAWSLAT